MSLFRRNALAAGIGFLAGGELPVARFGAKAAAATPADDLAVATSMGRFVSRTGMDLLARIVRPAPQSNAVVAPGSIVVALGMAAAATSDDTRIKLAAALAAEPEGGIALETLVARLGIFDRVLRVPADGTEIATAAALLIDRLALPDAAFLKSLETSLRARATSVSFTDPATVRELNRWIGDNTLGLITDPIKEFDPLTELVLATTAAFKGKWLHAFDKSRTRDGAFRTAAGRDMQLPMMTADQRKLAYLRQGPIHAIRLPYRGAAFEIVIATTETRDSAPLSTWIAEAGPDTWAKIIEPTAYWAADAVVTLPRQQIETKHELVPMLASTHKFAPLMANGVTLGRLTKNAITIRKVTHAALVRMDEEGTVAAAATIVEGVRRSIPPRPIEFRVDRPHVFVIRHVPTGTVVFAGYVAEPKPAPAPVG